MENESLEERAARMGYNAICDEENGRVTLTKLDASENPQVLENDHLATMVLMGIEETEKEADRLAKEAEKTIPRVSII